MTRLAVPSVSVELFEAASRMEAACRDEFRCCHVTDVYCPFCETRIDWDRDGASRLEPIKHVEDCPYKLLRDALVVESVKQRGRNDASRSAV